MRYSKTFKSGLITICLCLLLFGSIFAYAITAQVQYKKLIQNMRTTEAVITDIDIDFHSVRYGGYDQEMQISYVINGKIYNRELATDTKFSFEAGYRTNFSVGDVIEIYYDPKNPSIIATELSSSNTLKWMAFAGISFLFMLAIFIVVIATRKRFLITEEKYRKEKSDKKARKNTYKNSDGCKIRVQYFNYVLFGELCAFIMVIVSLSLNTLFGNSGTMLTSPAEIISLFFVFAMLTSPLWILSLINRRFFGRIICVVNDKGIQHEDKLIKWEDIREIEYEINPSFNFFSSIKLSCSYAKIIGKDFEYQILKSPFMLLKKAKKYNKSIKTHLSKGSIIMISTTIFAVVAIAVGLFLLIR